MGIAYQSFSIQSAGLRYSAKKLTDSKGNLVSFQLGHLNENEVAELEALFEKTTPFKTMTSFFSSVIPNSKSYKEVGEFWGYPVYSFKVGSDTFYLSYDEDISTHFFSENPVLNKDILEGLKGEKVLNKEVLNSGSGGSKSAGLNAKKAAKLSNPNPATDSAGSQLLAKLRSKTPAGTSTKIGAYKFLEDSFKLLIKLEKDYPTENSAEHQSMIKKLSTLLGKFIKANKVGSPIYLRKQVAGDAQKALKAVRQLAKDWERSDKSRSTASVETAGSVESEKLSGLFDKIKWPANYRKNLQIIRETLCVSNSVICPKNSYAS